MGAILPRMTIENGAAEHPQSADIPADIRRSSFGTLRARAAAERALRLNDDPERIKALLELIERMPENPERADD